MSARNGLSDFLSRRRDRRAFLIGAGGMALSTYLAVACRAEAPTGAASPGATAVGTGIGKFAYSTTPNRLDPHVATLAGEGLIIDNLYDPLFRYQDSPPKLVGHLAEDFSLSPDGTTYDIKIRKNATFHDGAPVTAADVLYSFKRVLELGAGPSAQWQTIVTPAMLSTPDANTMRIQLARAYAPLPDTLAWMYVVNSKLIESHVVSSDYGRDWLTRNEAGSGPWTLDSYEPASRVAMKRYPTYWKGWNQKYLNGWNFDVIREPATVKLALQQGTVHLTDLYTLTIDDMQSAAGAAGIVLETNETLGIIRLKMNNQKHPTNNVLFRRAMAFAFNYDAVVKDLLKGKTNRARSVIPFGFKYSKSYEGTPDHYVTNIDRARSLLAQSGVDVRGLGTLQYVYNGNDKTQENYGLILKSSLAPLGINIELQGVPVATLLERLSTVQSSPNFTRVGNTAFTLDPDVFCRQEFHSRTWSTPPSQFFAASFYKNERVDQLVDQGTVEVDEKKRAVIYENIQDLVHADSPDIWVDQQIWLSVHTPNLKGYNYSSLGAKPISWWAMHLDPPQ